MRVVVSIILAVCFYHTNAQVNSIKFNDNWYFNYTDTAGKRKSNKWYKANVPGTIHTDLMNHKLIPDPYYRDNEQKVQWVETASWKYEKKFNVPDSIRKRKEIQFVFDGLDTYATVILNNDTILEANNMFRQWTVDIKGRLKEENTITIIFHPDAEIAKRAKANHGILLPDNERVFVRKAQYQFGWD